MRCPSVDETTSIVSASQQESSRLVPSKARPVPTEHGATCAVIVRKGEDDERGDAVPIDEGTNHTRATAHSEPNRDGDLNIPTSPCQLPLKGTSLSHSY